jgi:hypothetical protein
MSSDSDEIYARRCGKQKFRWKRRSPMLRAMSDRSDLVFDPAAAYPAIATLRAALGRHDWPACRALLDAATPVDRSALIRTGAKEKGLEGFLRTVLDRDPADSTAGALLGHHLTAVGWAVRTGARAKNVSRAQFDGFHDWLRKAELVLIDAAARTPDDPAVWAARLPYARGLELGRSEARRRYDRLVAIDPHHLPGQMDFLQQLCPKWSGSWDLLHPFCREAMLATPPGSPHAMLVADGHIEHWLDLAQDDLNAGRSYLASEPVRTELYDAAHRSVWHPEFQRTYGWLAALHSFAFVFSVLDDHRAAASLFTAIGNLGTEPPWHYLGDAAETYTKSRARALTAAGATR